MTQIPVEVVDRWRRIRAIAADRQAIARAAEAARNGAISERTIATEALRQLLTPAPGTARAHLLGTAHDRTLRERQAEAEAAARKRVTAAEAAVAAADRAHVTASDAYGRAGALMTACRDALTERFGVTRAHVEDEL